MDEANPFQSPASTRRMTAGGVAPPRRKHFRLAVMSGITWCCAILMISCFYMYFRLGMDGFGLKVSAATVEITTMLGGKVFIISAFVGAAISLNVWLRGTWRQRTIVLIPSALCWYTSIYHLFFQSKATFNLLKWPF